MASFDLIQQAWVPVTDAGQRRDVSLLEALARAHEIDGLAFDDPLQAVAVLRQVLLPVVLDALGAPRSEAEWARRWEKGALDATAIGSYLSEHAARFDLFHPTHPFGQVAGLRTTKDENMPVSLLLLAVATGNNVPLFAARTEGEPPELSPAEAVRALLATHCWDTAAIKTGAIGDPLVRGGKTYGNPTGPVGQLGVIVPIGRTLAETILLNLPIIRQGIRGDDRPQWRAEPVTAEWRQRPALGILDLLTWQSRRLRLAPEIGGTGQVVRRVVLAAGDRLDQTPDYEPHTAWRQVDKPEAGQPALRPIRHQSGRAAWRGLAAMLATLQSTSDKVSTSALVEQLAPGLGDVLPIDFPLQVLTVGVVYGSQSAVVEDVVADLIPLPVLALTTDSAVRGLLLDVVAQADQLRNAANQLGDDLRRAVGGERLPWDKGQRPGDALVHEFTPAVRRMLAGLQRHPDLADKVDAAWRQAARQLALDVAEPLLLAAPPGAFLGRQESEKTAYRLSLAEARYRAAVTRILATPPTDQPDPLPATTGVWP
ncbi:MAG: type I-E CRISPR-associated protein Cse1/CasA [Sporichthyaceae bacterium]|nr:type I-E CRISPR-associated protein Cse1/CasA [Sporichthyaceae bacterium]